MLYPQLTKTRNLFSLDGLWEFYQGEHTPGTALTDSEPMIVPTSFNDIVVDKDKRLYIGDVWYRREIEVPKVAEDEELVLRFGSVTHNASVYLDGVLIVSHKGGFLPFECVVPKKFVKQSHVVVEVNANNELNYTTLPVGNLVEVNHNGQKVKRVKENFDFFNYAGIQRHVHLYTRPIAHIEDITITYQVEGLQKAELNIDVVATGHDNQVKITILDEEQNTVAILKDGKGVIDNVRLWEPLNSYLYTARVELYNDDVLVDSYDEPFGIRTVEVKDNQFLINNKPFYFKGAGKHEDSYINGRGINEAANLMDLNLMKSLGANSFRTSHYPYSEEMMRLADKMGFVVFDEIPAVGLFQNFTAALNILEAEEKKNTWEVMQTREAHESALKELIRRDKNHPCVVMWVVANEPASQEIGAREYFAPLVQLARDSDPQNRPVTIVNIMTAGPEHCLVADLIDVLCLNRYHGWYTNHGDLENAKEALKVELELWHKLYPTKPIMFTEYGADTLEGYHSMWDIPYTEEYQIDYYKMNHEVFDELDYFIGEHVWNFADFETNVMLIRMKGNHKGLFSRQREPKAVAHYFKERWNNIPHHGYK